MNFIYARERIPPLILKQDLNGKLLSCVNKSIFLAGPTPRDNETHSWRPDLITTLENRKFNGDVFIPEDRPGSENNWDLNTWDDQVEWEWAALDRADCIIFWVPRNMKTLPGLTTNVEFGLACALYAKKTVLGFPKDAEHCRYLQKLAKRFGISCYDNKSAVTIKAMEILNEQRLD